jgi:hypothetical protein
MERVTITVEDAPYPFHWESIKLDEKPIGFISMNYEVNPDYHFRAFKFPHWAPHLDYEQKFCGCSNTLTGARNIAQIYANYLIEEGF